MTNGSSGDGYFARGDSAPSGVQPPELPPAPEFDRRIKFHRAHLLGMAIVAILPLLAVFGVFGLHSSTVTTASEAIELSVRYTGVQRFKVRQPVRIAVTNIGAESLSGVEVSVSSAYLFAFSDVALTPSPSDIDDDTYNFLLSDIAPGETRRIATEMQAQRYWRHSGTVAWNAFSVAGEAVDSGSVDFATMVWP